MSKKELAAKIAALEAQVTLLQVQVAQMPYRSLPMPNSPNPSWSPPAWQITCDVAMDNSKWVDHIEQTVNREVGSQVARSFS